MTLGNIGYLDIIGAGLTTASPFATLTELSHLSLQDNDIVDVFPLQNLTGFSYLSLSGTKVTSIAPLVDNQGLSSGDTVDLTNAPIACATETANLTALTDRGIKLVGNPCK